MVLPFLVALLTANRTAQNEFFKRQLPEGIFPSHSALIRWVYEFRSVQGFYPSLAALKQRFPDVVFPPKKKETVDSSLSAILDHVKFTEIQKSFTAAKEALDKGETISSTLNLLKSKINAIGDYSFRSQDRFVGFDDSLDEAYRERVLIKKQDNAQFKYSPWVPINDLIGRSDYGDHSVIAARTSIGKTWLALMMAYHHVMMGERVLFTSREMTTEQLEERLEAIIFKLDPLKLRRASLSPKELRRWRHEKSLYRLSPFAKNLLVTGEEDSKGSGFAHILSKIESFRPTSVWVDGAYLLQHPGHKFTSDLQRWSYTSSQSKHYAKLYKVFWTSIVQGNREAENAQGSTRLSLKDIYGADTWAQDANTVFLLSGKRGSNARQLALAKSRESAIGDFNLTFQLSPYPLFPILGSTPAAGAGAITFSAA